MTELRTRFSDEPFVCETSPGRFTPSDRMGYFWQALKPLSMAHSVLGEAQHKADAAYSEVMESIQQGPAISAKSWIDLLEAHAAMKSALDEIVVLEMVHLVQAHGLTGRAVGRHGGWSPASISRLLRSYREDRDSSPSEEETDRFIEMLAEIAQDAEAGDK